eukprot:SAG31_NODE_1340_length_8709_cov_8.259117_7_plen_155_part_00
MRDSRGCTALMYACVELGDPQLASLLCAAGGGGSAAQVCRVHLKAMRRELMIFERLSWSYTGQFQGADCRGIGYAACSTSLQKRKASSNHQSGRETCARAVARFCSRLSHSLGKRPWLLHRCGHIVVEDFVCFSGDINIVALHDCHSYMRDHFL